jgi:hypothetical protein
LLQKYHTSIFEGKDLEIQLSNFDHMCATMGKVLNKDTKKNTYGIFYKILGSLKLIFSPEVCKMQEKIQQRRLDTAEMKFFIYVA